MPSVADAWRRIDTEVSERSGGRSRVVAVSKSQPLESIIEVTAAGCRRIGENYAQELAGKRPGLPDGVEIHFIGQLQTNKVRLVAGMVSLWHTVDRPSLVLEIAKRAPGAEVLLQVDLTGEPGKGGCSESELDPLLEMAGANGLAVRGLMTVGPTSADIDETRRVFAATRRLAESRGLPELSMGMSADWPIGVDEGSTLVRIGTAIFGHRPPAP